MQRGRPADRQCRNCLHAKVVAQIDNHTMVFCSQGHWRKFWPMRRVIRPHQNDEPSLGKECPDFESSADDGQAEE